jgi:hypothetical protein
MKKLRALALSLMMLVMSLVGLSPAQAIEDGTVNCGTSGTFTIVDNQVTTNTNCQGSLIIPEGVTSIMTNAFNVGPDRSSYITSIVFPNSLTTIYESAFRAASRLTSIDFGTGIQSIIHWNFADSVALTSVTIPSSVIYIGTGVFCCSSQLESVTFLGNAPSKGSFPFINAKAGAVANVVSETAGFGANGAIWSYLLVSVAAPAPSAPGAPTIGTASALSPTSASISFTAPTSNGGAAIETYTATSTPGTVTGILLQSGNGSVTVTGLTSSTAYTFRVTATNSAGTSSPSSATISITMPASAEELAAQTAAAAAAKAAADLAAQKAAEAKREAEKKDARLGIYNNFIYYNTPTIQMFNIAEIYGVNAKNYYYVTNEIQYLMWKYNNIYSGQDIKALAYLWNYNNNSVMWNYQTNTLVRDESATALSWNLNSTMHVVENVVLKYSIMDSMCQPGIFSQYSGNDLSSVGLIPTKYQSLITYYLRKTPLNQRDDYYKIMGAIQNEIALIQLRELRLSKVLSWNLIYSN